MDDVEKILEAASEAFSSEQFEYALSLIMPLVERRNPAAIGMLGKAYQFGSGVEMNARIAVSLLEEAIALGDGVAANNLGLIYVWGLPGIEPDPAKAEECYRLAEARGAVPAADDWFGWRAGT